MKNVLIATPCLDGRVEAYFTNSLYESVKLGIQNDIMLQPIFLAYESILPMARNELFNLAYKQQYDSMVFIDDDECWNPQCLIEIIQSEKNVISIPVVNKGDKKIQYNVYGLDEKTMDPVDGYYKIQKSGTGFLKLSKKVIKDLWESNPDCEFRGKILKNICEYANINESFVGEDIMLSKKIRELGYTIWCNPNYTVSHIGTKMYQGNFAENLNNGK